MKNQFEKYFSQFELDNISDEKAFSGVAGQELKAYDLNHRQMEKNFQSII
ncbi:hypothetical protein [Photobacterium sanctipauli]|nr:hypothetical protein [Photobacterium sanctipauli]